MRRGPFVNGVERMRQLELVAGGSIVVTCPSGFLSDMWELDENLEFKPTIEDVVSDKILEKLLRIPYFSEAYQEQMDPNRFVTLATTVFTIQEFTRATEKMVEIISSRIAVVRSKR
jgi:transaldolase